MHRLNVPNLCLLAGGVLVTVLTSGCGNSDASGPGASGNPPPLPTVTAAYPLVKQTVEWDAYTGRLEAVNLVEIRARVGGYLQSIHFDEGQVVEEGDLLFVIDPRPYEAELNSARAQLQQAESRLKQSHALLDEAKAKAVQSQAQLNLTDVRYERIKNLNQRNASSQEELDEREAEFLQAKADLEGVRAGIHSAEAAIATAEAEIEIAKAGVETAELNLRYTRIEAPVTGRISRQAVTEGNLIAGGTSSSPALTTITSMDPIYCVFDATERDVLKYVRLAQAGQRESARVVRHPVYLGLVDEQGFPHQGHMDFVDNRFDTNTASMRARCVFPNDNQLLLPGMFGRIRIPGSAPYRAVLIPDSAIGTDQSSQYVYVLMDAEIEQNEDGEDVLVKGRVERRPIKPGPMADGLRVIREGLEGDELIITQGLLRARPGSEVAGTIPAIEAEDDGLPDDYQPVPEEESLSPLPDPLPEELKMTEVSR
ncbi:efflux RND transporter periplasmic adaptor subunit [Roseimaritima ulvae]|uniref:Multidrug resistance protein MexA n=1 Tax=Roseimaritima ulvae TaxID=980254 RepID=A0A5B9QTB6_9BACT|nr:efflux RND transporter periplasmic adaptor subunit [Roseimaritima ulvae]QEG40980.1 Multidrug resistance protein MexA precursor [Roseimaritima ulvae]